MMQEERNNMEYFRFEKRRTELLNELEKWRGTIFQYSTNGIAQPGITADCVSFPINVFKRLKLVPENYSTPCYCSRPSDAKMLNKIYDCMDHHIPGLIKIWDRNEYLWNAEIIKFGDIAVCSYRCEMHHLLIYIGGGIACDCWPKTGVRKIEIKNNNFGKNVKRVYRWYE
jgi:hypothetical protein